MSSFNGAFSPSNASPSNSNSILPHAGEKQQSDEVDMSDDDSADMSEEEESDDEIANPAMIPIMLLDMAEEMFEKGTDSHEKAIAALEKAKMVSFHLHADVKNMFDKFKARMLSGKAEGKVPPGSADVTATRVNTRYLLSLICILQAKIMSVRHLNESNEETIMLLREALIFFPRSVTANYLLSRALRPTVTNNAGLASVELLLKKASAMAVAGSADEVSKERKLQGPSKEALSLLLCQDGRVAEAHKYLRSCGFTWRLSKEVFCYDGSGGGGDVMSDSSGSDKYVQARDGAVPAAALQHLRHLFRPDSPFWKEHHYDLACNASRTVGYFSYKYPLRERRAMNSVEQVVDLVYRQVETMFPAVKEATVAEWWVHSRPHSSGHQLHFDSDETRIAGGGTPQHPICSCVLYLEEDGSIGGPTLVTDQTLNGAMATQGWLCYPHYGRLVAFDARHLHGVIPGRGVNPDPAKRRLTFMVGFWRTFEAKDRGEANPGPGQPLPAPSSSAYSWPAEMGCQDGLDGGPGAAAAAAASSAGGAGEGWLPVLPRHLQRVWEPIDVDGGSSLKLGKMKMPQYTQLFQGF